MPHIYVSTACLTNTEPVLERIRSYQEAGIHAIELGARVTVSEAALACIPDLEAEFLVHNYFPPPVKPFILNLASSDRDVRRRSLKLAREAIELSTKLNAPFYSIHAGFITDPIGFGTTSFRFPAPDSPDEGLAALERYVESIQQLVPLVKHAGIRLLIENNVCPTDLKGKLLLQTPDEFLELFSHVDTDALGILLDTGHLTVSAKTYGFDPLDFVDRLKDRIHGFHLSANDGLADLAMPVSNDDWSIGILKLPIFESTTAVVESQHESTADLARHVNWLKETLRRE
jgi:sugar phosphate isomerase/epimerase